MIVKGLNVPPELQKDFYNATEVRAQQDRVILARRRTGSGIPTKKRQAVNRAFRGSVCCWHMQDQAAKEQWYEESLGTGMRYYNYFHHKTIPEIYRGNIPDWCVETGLGMMEVAGTWWDWSDFAALTEIRTGDVLRVEIQITWAGFGEWWDPTFPIFPFPDTWSVRYQISDKGWPALELGIRNNGLEGCGMWEYEEYGSPESRNITWNMSGRFQDYVPAVLSLERVAPFDIPSENGPMWIHSISVDNMPGWAYGGEKPVAWVIYSAIYVNGVELSRFTPDDPPATDPDPEIPVIQVINHSNDPYSRYGHDYPICGV